MQVRLIETSKAVYKDLVKLWDLDADIIQAICCLGSLILLLQLTNCTNSGFYDGDASFGLMKKGIVHTSSDFNFTLLAEVICSVPASSGYLINLTPLRGKMVLQGNTVAYVA